MIKAAEPKMVSITDLVAKSLPDTLEEYAASLPDGKAVTVGDVSAALGFSVSRIEDCGKKMGVLIQAYHDRCGQMRKMNFITNPNTCKKWQAAQKQKA